MKNILNQSRFPACRQQSVEPEIMLEEEIISDLLRPDNYEPEIDDIREFYSLLGFGLWRVAIVECRPQKIEMDQNFLEMIGTAETTVLPENLNDFISNYVHSDDWTEVVDPFSECLTTRNSKISFEHRLLNRRTGQWRWVRSIIRSRQKNHGATQYIFGATQDVHMLYTALNEIKQFRQASPNRIDLPPQSADDRYYFRSR